MRIGLGRLPRAIMALIGLICLMLWCGLILNLGNNNEVLLPNLRIFLLLFLPITFGILCYLYMANRLFFEVKNDMCLIGGRFSFSLNNIRSVFFINDVIYGERSSLGYVIGFVFHPPVAGPFWMPNVYDLQNDNGMIRSMSLQLCFPDVNSSECMEFFTKRGIQVEIRSLPL
jgi:hypothetical protein